MASMFKKPSWDDLTETLKIQAQVADMVRSLVERDPALARALMQQMAALVGLDAEAGSRRPSTPNGAKEQTAYEKVAEYFAKRDNKLATKQWIIKGAEVKKGTLRSILYITNTSDFENVRNPSGGRERAFRLNAQALAVAKAKLPSEVTP